MGLAAGKFYINHHYLGVNFDLIVNSMRILFIKDQFRKFDFHFYRVVQNSTVLKRSKFEYVSGLLRFDIVLPAEL